MTLKLSINLQIIEIIEFDIAKLFIIKYNWEYKANQKAKFEMN